MIEVLPRTPLFDRVKRIILVWAGTRVGNNVHIDRHVYIRDPENLVIGNNVVISKFTVLTCSGGIEIGDDSLIGYGTKIISAFHGNSTESLYRLQEHTYKKVRISNNCWIGSNAVILGANIGANSIIGAGAVVTKDMPEYVLAAGVPAKIIKKKNGTIKKNH